VDDAEHPANLFHLAIGDGVGQQLVVLSLTLFDGDAVANVVGA
jgi:hypothetical protein